MRGMKTNLRVALCISLLLIAGWGIPGNAQTAPAEGAQ